MIDHRIISKFERFGHEIAEVLQADSWTTGWSSGSSGYSPACDLCFAVICWAVICHI